MSLPSFHERLKLGHLTIVCIAATILWMLQVSARRGGPARTADGDADVSDVDRQPRDISGSRRAGSSTTTATAGYFRPARSPSPTTRSARKSTSTATAQSGSVVYSYQRTKTGADNRKEVDLDFGLEFGSEGRFLLRCRDKGEPQASSSWSRSPGSRFACRCRRRASRA